MARQVALVATILTAATGCDKTMDAAAAGPGALGADGAATAADTLELATRPKILYQVFGERQDPRILPVAALIGGAIRPLVLSADGWQQFDSLYHQPGTTYTVYQDGRPAGTARVRRPMWNERGEPLYTLPRCQQLTPLAAADVKAPSPAGYLVEHLATNAPLTPSPGTRRARKVTGDDAIREARTVAGGVGEAFGLDPDALAALDFRAVAVNTGAGPAATLVISFVDPAAGTTGVRQAAHLFVVADRPHRTANYLPTYTRIVRGTSVRSDYRRYVDHLDLTGDGVDELVLEGWSNGNESYMLILQFTNGRWTEVFRSRPSWCLDE